MAGAQRLFDLWTAEPLGLAGARNEALLHGAELLAGAATPLVPEAEQLAERERFLHWPLAFPDVFARERPGFDAVVGNPPWEEVTVEELSRSMRCFRPGIRRGLPEHERRTPSRSSSPNAPTSPDPLAREQAAAQTRSSYFTALTSYARIVGDPDLYKLFCQRYRTLLRTGGTLGVVLPRRTPSRPRGPPRSVTGSSTDAAPDVSTSCCNRRRWAFDVHAQRSVALLVADGTVGDHDRTFDVAGIAESADGVRAADLATQASSCAAARFGLRSSSRSFPTRQDADFSPVFDRLGPFPLARGAGGAFPCRATSTRPTQRALWEGKREGWPLWKGESFEQFITAWT